MESQRRWIWLGAVLVIFAAIVLFFFIRANPPKERVETYVPKIISTSGVFVTSPQTIDPATFLHFKFVIDGKKRLNGKFMAAGYKDKIDFFVLDEQNFELFKIAGEFKKIVGTGAIPGGKIDRIFEPGTYYIVFDNQQGNNKINLVESNFSID